MNVQTTSFSLREHYDEVLELPADIYPLEAVVLACYTFIDKAYFHITGRGGNKKPEFIDLGIRLKPGSPEGMDTEKLTLLVQNSLVSQALRLCVLKMNRDVRKHVIGRALASARHTADSRAADQDPPQEISEP